MGLKTDVRTALCLDSTKAWIAEFANDRERIAQVESGLSIEMPESQVDNGVAEAYDDMELRRCLRPLRDYFDEVIDVIGRTDALLIGGDPAIINALLERLGDRDIGSEMTIDQRDMSMTSFAEFRLRAKSYYS